MTAGEGATQARSIAEGPDPGDPRRALELSPGAGVEFVEHHLFTFAVFGTQTQGNSHRPAEPGEGDPADRELDDAHDAQ